MVSKKFAFELTEKTVRDERMLFWNGTEKLARLKGLGSHFTLR